MKDSQDKQENIKIEGEQGKKYNLNKVVRITIFAALITILILMLFLSKAELVKINEEMKKIKIGYLLIAMLILLINFFIRPITLVILSRIEKLPIRKREVYLINLTEPFFDGVTPFATGGQPFEIYAMTRLKVKGSQATSLLMINLIITMIATDVVALLSLIYAKHFLVSLPVATQVLAILGFLFLFFVLGFFISIGVSNKLKLFIIKIILLFGKIKVFSKLIERKKEGIIQFMDQLQASFKTMFSNVKIVVISILIKIITLLVYYTIPLFIIKALSIDYDKSQIFIIVAATAFVTSVVTWIPTPGSSGGIEYFFREILFVNILGSTLVVGSTGMLLWRLITYYFLMSVGFIAYVVLELQYSKYLKTRKNNLINIENNCQAEEQNMQNKENICD